LTVLDPDPYCQYGSGSGSREAFQYGSTWIRIRNTAIYTFFLFSNIFLNALRDPCLGWEPPAGESKKAEQEDAAVQTADSLPTSPLQALDPAIMVLKRTSQTMDSSIPDINSIENSQITISLGVEKMSNTLRDENSNVVLGESRGWNPSAKKILRRSLLRKVHNRLKKERIYLFPINSSIHNGSARIYHYRNTVVLLILL